MSIPLIANTLRDFFSPYKNKRKKIVLVLEIQLSLEGYESSRLGWTVLLGVLAGHVYA